MWHYMWSSVLIACLCSPLRGTSSYNTVRRYTYRLQAAFHYTDTDILARILADTSDTRDFLKLLLWQAERHADILATIFATMSAMISV